MAAAFAAVPSTTVAGCGLAARHTSYCRCTAASASATLVWSICSRVGIRRIAPAFRSLMLSLKNASGFADFRAIIIWLTVAPVSGVTRLAIRYRVSPRRTGAVREAGAAAADGDGG